MTFFSRLESRIRTIDSLLCIGLDPHENDLPVFTAEAAKEFCLSLIEATIDVAAAFKPNIAFFEAMGPTGISALSDVIAAVPDEIPVILDAKRGDISSTAIAYAQAAFQTLGVNAITINPYLGFDAVEPFLNNPENGVFLLCKTSNPGAADLQDVQIESTSLVSPLSQKDILLPPSIPLYIHVAMLAQKWNTRNNLGLVVGATHPDSLTMIRSVAPDLWILAPGVGAQGGDLHAALSAGLRADGLGILVPVSRGISRTNDPTRAAYKVRDDINQVKKVLSKYHKAINEQQDDEFSESLSPDLAGIANALLEAGCIKFGRFTLKSGTDSPFYIDLRRLVGYPKLLQKIASTYINILRELQFDHLGALPYAALPITSAISLISNWTMIYPRKEAKSYGTKVQIEGVYEPGDKVVVIDDLISTGGSKFEGIQKLESEGLSVEDVVVLIDRSPDGMEVLKRSGYELHSVFKINQILDHYELTGLVDKLEIEATRLFLKEQSQKLT
jgi:uridine monophosphate synthetase